MVSVRLEVITVVLLEIWDITLCCWMSGWYTYPLKMKALCSFQASGTTHPVTQHYISEDQSPQHWSSVCYACFKSFASWNYCCIPSPSRAVSRSCGISWWSNVQDRRILSRFIVVSGCSLAPRFPIGESYSVECYSKNRQNTQGCRVVNRSSHMLLAQRSYVFVPCSVH